jgi:hypothetical protein
MQAHRFNPVKGSVLPEEPLELCEEVVLELTEPGAVWDSLGELDVVEVVAEFVDVAVLVPLELVLWWWREWGWPLSGSTYWELPAEPPPPPARAVPALSSRTRTMSPQASTEVRGRITGYSSSVRGLCG